MELHTSRTDTQVVVFASRWRALYMTGVACILLLIGILAMSKLLLPSLTDYRHVPGGGLGIAFMAVYCLMSLYLVATYATWAFSRIPVLHLTREELRIRVLPWWQRTVRWEAASQIEMRVRATLGFPSPLYGRRQPAWLYVTLRPHARRTYRGKKRLRLLMPMYLISLEINEVADVLDRFFPIERVVLPL